MMRIPKILIAGYEIGGQMQLLAEAMRRRGIEATSVAFNDDFRKFENDIYINPKGLVGVFRKFAFFLRALYYYDVFYFFWGVSLLNIWRFHNLDLPVIKFLGKKIIIHFRGTDVVNIHYYKPLLANRMGAEMDHGIPRSRPDQIRKIKTWEKYADHILVSTPDLLFVSPRAVLSPQIIRISDWVSYQKKTYTYDKEVVIRVAHAPTRRHTKGTDTVIEVVQALKEDGYNIELVLIENVPYKEMQPLLAQCDIGIDQLVHGWYGKIAVEMMALGLPVICFIDDNLRKPESDLPLINADISSLKRVLRDTISNPALRQKAGEKGIKYVQQHHDADTEAVNLLRMLNLLI